MTGWAAALGRNFTLAAPLFSLVGVGYLISRWARWPGDTAAALSRFVFSVALPALLFRLMGELSRLPAVDLRVLLAFFGGCLIVFAVGRLLGRWLFGLDPEQRSMFAMGGVFSNNVLLGVPLVTSLLGARGLPATSLVLVFNALILWTLATVSIEWARQGSFSVAGLRGTARSVLTNPVVAAILTGTGFGLTGLSLPAPVDTPLAMLGTAATPLALVALGMSLVEYPVGESWPVALGITAVKLLLQPAVVWGLALLLGLSALDTAVVTLLASIAVGANVFLMSRRFGVLQGPVAASLVLSTALAAVTTPVWLTLVSTS